MQTRSPCQTDRARATRASKGLVYPAAGASRVLIKTFLRLGLHVFLIFIESTRR